MTTETDTTTRAAWERLKARYLILLSLVEADEKDGPLAQAEGDGEAEEQALEHHMVTIWNPMHEAAQALFEAPAPDVEAVRFKIAMLSGRGDVCCYVNEASAFDVISADAVRFLQ